MHPPLPGTDAGGEHPSTAQVDVAGAVFLGEQAAVALGQTAYHGAGAGAGRQGCTDRYADR
ncbi:MAG: hypothetical protein ACJ8CN_10170 [Gemmatimonadales bacterium]